MLLEMLVTQVCFGLEGPRREACTKAAEAATVQYAIAEDVRIAENKAADLIKGRVVAVAGSTALAITLYTAKVIRDKEVSANLIREAGRMPSTNVRATQNSGRITFSWSF